MIWNQTTGIKAKRVFDYEISSDPRWQEFRTLGIGGSDISAICGVNPYRSALDVYASKVAKLKTEENEFMRWGVALEPVIAREFAVRHPEYNVQRVKSILRHETDEIAIVNLDRILLRSGEKTGVLEIKTASEYALKNWKDGDVPDMYMAQGQWELYVTGLDWGVFAVLIGGNKYREIRFERNESIIQPIVQKAHDFWNNHVLKGIAPNPSQASDADLLSEIFAKSNGQEIELPESSRDLVETILREEQRQKAAEEAAEVAKAKLKALLADAECGHVGEYVVSWKSTADIAKFDAKAFQESNPDLYMHFVQKKPGYRRFAIKQTKNAMREAA